jgi:hypothetical protein
MDDYMDALQARLSGRLRNPTMIRGQLGGILADVERFSRATGGDVTFTVEGTEVRCILGQGRRPGSMQKAHARGYADEDNRSDVSSDGDAVGAGVRVR